MGTLCLAKREEIGSKLCFRSVDEKIRKRSASEIDHLTNISMNRTVEQLAENAGEKKNLFKELK